MEKSCFPFFFFFRLGVQLISKILSDPGQICQPCAAVGRMPEAVMEVLGAGWVRCSQLLSLLPSQKSSRYLAAPNFPVQILVSGQRVITHLSQAGTDTLRLLSLFLIVSCLSTKHTPQQSILAKGLWAVQRLIKEVRPP